MGASAVETKSRKTHAGAVFKPDRLIALFALHALVALLHILAQVEVGTVFGIKGPVGIVDVFTVYQGSTHVAVSVVATVHGVVAIFAQGEVVGNARNFGTHFGKLVEKRSVEIEVLAIGERIELIAQITVLAVDGKRFVGRANAHDKLFAQVTIAFVKVAIVAKRKTTLAATIGAKLGLRDLEFGQKHRVFWGNLKVLATTGTRFCTHGLSLAEKGHLGKKGVVDAPTTVFLAFLNRHN